MHGDAEPDQRNAHEPTQSGTSILKVMHSQFIGVGGGTDVESAKADVNTLIVQEHLDGGTLKRLVVTQVICGHKSPIIHSICRESIKGGDGATASMNAPCI